MWGNVVFKICYLVTWSSEKFRPEDGIPYNMLSWQTHDFSRFESEDKNEWNGVIQFITQRCDCHAFVDQYSWFSEIPSASPECIAASSMTSSAEVVHFENNIDSQKSP